MGDTTGIEDTTCELEGVTDITELEEGDGVGLIGGAGVGGLNISPVIDMTNGTTLLTVLLVLNKVLTVILVLLRG